MDRLSASHEMSQADGLDADALGTDLLLYHRTLARGQADLGIKVGDNDQLLSWLHLVKNRPVSKPDLCSAVGLNVI